MGRLLALAFLLGLGGCTAAAPKFPPPTGETVTVFIHGYRGSFLVTDDARRKRVYLRPGDVLTAGKANLALSYPGQRVSPTWPALAPDGPLTKLTLLPLLVSIDVYLGWMEFGRDQLPGFIPFAYDWRQDVNASGRRFCDFLAGLKAQHVQIVAHSMGGLVTWSCLTQNEAVARRVKKVVFAGTPFKGGPGIFDDLLLGTSTGLNRSLLSREALFTFASSYQLLSARSDFFVDAAGAPVTLDAFSAQEWVTGRWGLFEGQSSAAELAQLQRLLDGHGALHARLARPPLSMPEVLAVIGTGRATVSGVRVTAEGFDFQHPPTADGDDSVLAASAVPPVPFTRFDTPTEHVALLNDPAVQRAIAAFLNAPAQN
ncbi:MAG: hypothetical protein H6Q89_2506 [Myxococcaceae bacterium]|nr:hypothetical protein [Myxococcaceae bacterium]